MKDSAPRRNQFVRFDRTFDLAAVPETFPISLFADTRYRLWVNGEFVATGPGRFVTQFPEFDTHDVAHRLRVGSNSLLVEVNFYGASSYQSMPDGEPGFIAWGGDGEVDLTTPGDWQAFHMDAWRWDAPLFSFAQGPVEICDTRLSCGGVPVPMVAPGGASARWSQLAPYSGVPIPFFVHRPQRLEMVGHLASCEKRLGFMLHDPNASVQTIDKEELPWAGFATWILSPKAQAVTLSCFWSDLLCNGTPIAIDTDTPLGNHGHCSLDLQEGWNLLAGKVQILTEFWTYCLGIPAAGLSFHGCQDAACEEPFAILPKAPLDEVVLPMPGDTAAPSHWVLHDGDPQALTPARMMGWDIPAADARRALEPEQLAEVSTIVAAEATWCFSFAGEFLGHVVLDVEAPEGTVMDVACDDWQAAHGGVALYQSNPFTDSADRFILRGGRQRVELFHPRGGKFLQVTLRSPGGASLPLSLHDVFVRSRQALGVDSTRFSSDHDILNWAWPVAMRTLIVSTDEAYSDCPWRERGSYIGDGYVNIHLDLLLNGDYRTARRTLRLFAQAQLPDGQLACCAPSWLRKPHEDFTLIWLLTLHDFWAATGDTELVEELWPVVQKIWQSPSWECHSSGLWNATGKRLFIDWGVLKSEREGEANAVINLFRFGAAKACANLAVALGKTDEASVFTSGALAVEAALTEHLWNDAEGCLRPSLRGTTPALHANTLALAFQLGEETLRSRILTFLEPRLRDNLTKGIRDGQNSGHLELYFLHYALPALAMHGRPDLAEMLIGEHYGFLRDKGFDTLGECICRVERSIGSLCHSWSGAAAIYAARYVLGIRPSAPGNPRELLFEPIVHGIKRASGRIAHPQGWIDVSWVDDCGVFSPMLKAPAGVDIVLGQRSKNLLHV